MSEIPALISDMSDLHRQLAECDENLGSPQPSVPRLPAGARISISPCTRRPVRAWPGQKPNTGRATDKLSFAEDTAAKTGKDIRTVQRDAERGEKISEEAIVLVAGTRLDKGTYLDTLKEVPA